MNMQHTTQHLQALVEAYMDADRDAAQCDHPTRDRARACLRWPSARGSCKTDAADVKKPTRRSAFDCVARDD